MRSNTCYLYRKEGRDKVLREVEKTAQYCELEHEQELQLRLLAEELTGMAESITGEYKGMFWIEAEDGNFCLHLQMEKPEDEKTREQLLSISSKSAKGPKAASGVMGKIRNLFENCMDHYEELEKYGVQNGMGSTTSGDLYAGCVTRTDSIVWSLKGYETAMEEASEEWDELEKSIVVNLADDIVVDMKKDRAEITIYKRFEW